MGSTERRALAKTATREKILAAARCLFLKEGFESVSMRKIAQAIDYTAASLYNHFKDKTQLLMALGDADFGLLRETMRGVESIPDPVDRLRAGGRAYIRFAFEHPHHYRLMFMTKWPAIDVKQCGIEHGNPDEDAYACLRGDVEACIKHGRFKPQYRDVQRVTQSCWAAVHGVVSLYLTHGDDPWVDFQSPRETADMLLNASLDGMLSALPGAAVGKAKPKLRVKGGGGKRA